MSNLFDKIGKDFDKKNEIPKLSLDFTKFRMPVSISSNPFSEFERIVKDIQDRQDNAMAMEFTKCIGEFLKKNGVFPKITEYTHETSRNNSIEAMYGISIDELDFSEHDKVFENKILELKAKIEIKNNNYKTVSGLLSSYQQENESLKQRIAELENKGTVDLPFDPLQCADYLINTTYERETNGLERAFHNLPEKINSNKYSIEQLEQIAEHLLIYCKHNKECE